ncbi:MAG: hypothetical protein IJZ96_05875, partial [Lachnospiraceae bacterium]|nr:hypothetical protein [Lachnospiraceae bacterium]
MGENSLDMKQPVLAMYDVRGIQSFIFRTNKVKEIRGASALVENIIQDALKDAVSKTQFEERAVNAILEWENSERLEFLEGDSVDVQTLFVGGGNAYVMYRTGELALSVNKLMSRYVLDKTYSLQLAVAMVNSTDSYSKDYENVQLRMSEIKASMPYSGCLGALPIVETDDMSGFPISMEDRDFLVRNHRLEAKASLSKESLLKLEAYYSTYADEANTLEKKHENLITEFGKDSTIAVVHIDGNNMGMRIRDLLAGMNNYTDAVIRMRQISYNINKSFKDSFEKVVEETEAWINDEANDVLKVKIDKKYAKYIRKIIVAGDDITFVCNGKIALAIVEAFVRDVTKKVMHGDASNSEDVKKYGMSVCAGIAYVHSHFPFSTAYQVAEECCDSAKTRAKEDKNKEGERIGNWVDFQICKDVQNIDLENNRNKDYMVSEDEWLLRRPYYVSVENSDNSYSDMNDQNKAYDF